MQEVEELLIGLILEGKVEGRIDQVGMRLEVDRKSVPSLILGYDSYMTLVTGKVSRRNDIPHYASGQKPLNPCTEQWWLRRPPLEEVIRLSWVPKHLAYERIGGIKDWSWVGYIVLRRPFA